jgi:hypothetical protein
MVSAATKIAMPYQPVLPVRVRHLPARQTPGALLKLVMAEQDNESFPASQYALDALTDNRAAFWTKSEAWHHSIANCVMMTACRLGSLDLALDEEVTDYWKRNGMVGQVLDLLIPLNSAAVVQLKDAYEAIGTFRSSDELLDRQCRSEVAA